MFRLGEAILQTLLESSTEPTKQTEDPIAIMRSEYPLVAARDIASELTVLAAQGFVKLTAQHGAIITAAGLRKVHDVSEREKRPDFSGLQALQDFEDKTVCPEPKIESENSELELDEIIALISGSSPPKPSQAKTNVATPEKKLRPK